MGEQIVTTVLPQDILQEIPQHPVVECIQEQIVDIPREQIEVQIWDIPQLIAEVTTLDTSSTSTSSSSASTSSDRRLEEFTNILESCIALLTPMTAQKISRRNLEGLRC